MSGITFKRIMSLGAVALTAGLGTLILQGCGDKATPKSQTKVFKKTNFEAVTSRLDPNGDLYIFADTTNFMNKIDVFAGELKGVIGESISDPEPRRLALSGIDLAMKCFRESGMKNIGGFGASSIMIKEDLFRNKVFLYKNKGGVSPSPFWNLMGKAPHELKTLKMLPADTAAANFFDFNAEMGASWLEQQIKSSGIPELNQGLAKFETQSKGIMGVDYKTLLASFDNHAGMFITLDKNKKGMIPAGDKLMQIPEPALAFVLAVKDERIYELIKSKIPPQFKAKENNLEGAKTTIFDQLPFPVRIQPVIAQKDGLLVIATNPDIIKNFFSANAAKLTGTDEFKALAENIPLNANGFKYVSSQFGKVIADVQRQIMASNSQNMVPLTFFNKLNSLNSTMTVFSTYQVIDDGIMSVFNSNWNMSTVMLTQVSIAPTAIMAGMLLPALNSAREKARRISCSSNLKSMGLALKQYAMDHQDKFPEADGVAGLEVIRKDEYLFDPKVYVCPSTSQRPAQSGQPLKADNVSYVYFGGFMEGADVVNMPLIFDRPGNHKNYINILFGDGHVGGFSGKFNNCRDVVEYIIKTSPGKISEKNRKLLLKKAELFDTGKVR
ncbi:MAG: DUF1559 domain-containing protein [Victivallales bacterium]|nr:DUF1559 domain-containing protein [Victivallales bacterium]